MGLRSVRVGLLVALVTAAAGCARHRMQEARASGERPPAQAAAPVARPAPPPATPTPPLEPAAAPTPLAASEAPAPAADVAAAFARDVKPVLVQRCSPCHFPGGIMHARLPFDDPATVPPIREGILRRIKVPEERAALERWLAGAAPQ